MKRRAAAIVTIVAWGSVGGFAAGADRTHPNEVRPNILWLIAEDMGPALGCYGQKEVETPNLDRLAAEGTRFTRAYTTAPVCSPSRSAFMTGMFQTTIGAHNHRSHRDDGFRLPNGVRLVTEWFHDAGYFCANIVQLPPPIGFRGTGKTDWNFTPPSFQFDSQKWSDLKAHQPFFAQINFSETHRKFRAPKKANPAKIELPPYYPDHPVVRQDYAEYLDAASELDRKVGLILRQLDAEGLAERTVIVFFADNGEAMIRGKQFCYEDGLRVPLIIRWPAQVPAPAHYARGKVDDRLISSIDLAPTMLALAGAPVPPIMQGRVFLGEKTAPPHSYVFGARDRCDETVFRFRTVRDERYRYIRNFTPDRPFLQTNDYKARAYPLWTLLPKLHAEGILTPPQAALCAPTMPEEELFDLSNDPHQIRNLAHDPQFKEVRDRMRAVLDRWIEESNDQGKELEPEELARNKGVTQRGTHPNRGYAVEGRAVGADVEKATRPVPR